MKFPDAQDWNLADLVLHSAHSEKVKASVQKINTKRAELDEEPIKSTSDVITLYIQWRDQRESLRVTRVERDKTTDENKRIAAGIEVATAYISNL